MFRRGRCTATRAVSPVCLAIFICLQRKLHVTIDRSRKDGVPARKFPLGNSAQIRVSLIESERKPNPWTSVTG
jgi:hypothetical protein